MQNAFESVWHFASAHLNINFLQLTYCIFILNKQELQIFKTKQSCLLKSFQPFGLAAPHYS
jgi:hypothetical protein